MHLPKTLPLLLAAGLGVASPVYKRDNTTLAVDSNTAVNFVLNLEYLQNAFFKEGLHNFTQADFVGAGLPDTFYDNLKLIYEEDQTQIKFLVDYLTTAGVTPVQPSTYAFGVPDVKFFLTLLSTLEGVGLSAYLGATTPISDKAGLLAVESILAVQARHSSYIRNALGQGAFPNAFETPIDFDQANTLTSVFIVHTPASNPKFPFKIATYLELECSQYYYEADRSSVTFQGAFSTAQKTNNLTASTQVYAVFLSGLQKMFVPARITNGNADYKIDKIPAVDAGQVYAVLSTSPTSVDSTNSITGPAILQVYPKGKAPAGPVPPCL